MRFLKRFFIILFCLLGVIFALYLVDAVSISVSADVLTVVDLSREQTLALYGTLIQGQYYTGSEWKQCTFEYFDPPRLNADPYTTNIIDTYNTGYTSQQIDSLLRSNEFLFYRCPVGDLVPPPISSGHYVQFNLDFSVAIQGIAYFRQIVGMGTGEQTSSGFVSSSLRPWSDMFYVSSNVSYSPTPIISYGRGDYQNELTAWFSCPLGWSSNSSDFHFDNIAKFFFSDVYLQDVDSTTGLENTFALSGQQFTFNYAQQYYLPVNSGSHNITPDPGAYYYIIALSTPRVTDGYVLPDVTTPSLDLSSQLDTLIDVNTQSNTTLQEILVKLNLIYQQMQQGEATPTLQDPERIGFDSRTKQEMLDGLHNGESALDGVAPSDLGTAAAGGMYDFWDRLTGVFPPGLMAVYMFALIGGIVSWVIFGRRGG